MSADPLNAMIRDLNQSLLSLATLGAALQLQRAGAPMADPETADAIAATLAALGAPQPNTIPPNQANQALGLIRTFFAEAHDLLEDPARTPGWRFQDPAILQGIGASSAGMVARMAALAASRPWFGAVLSRTGTFLDIGTGVGGIALAAAAAWPTMRVLGIDNWPPSLALAESNRTASPVAARVRFEHRALQDVNERDAYAMAWLPTPFIDRAVIEQALPRLHTALEPGGAIVAGVIPPPNEALPAALCRLRARRNGGHAWPCGEMAGLLNQAGFTEVEVPTGQAGIHFLIGRKQPLSATFP